MILEEWENVSRYLKIIGEILKITEMQTQHYQPSYKLLNSRDTLFSLWLKNNTYRHTNIWRKRSIKTYPKVLALVVIPKYKIQVIVFSFA